MSRFRLAVAGVARLRFCTVAISRGATFLVVLLKCCHISYGLFGKYVGMHV